MAGSGATVLVVAQSVTGRGATVPVIAQPTTGRDAADPVIAQPVTGHGATVAVITQTIEHLVNRWNDATSILYAQPEILYVDPKELYDALRVTCDYPPDDLTPSNWERMHVALGNEENVLKAYHLNMPAFDCENHPLAAGPVEADRLVQLLSDGLHIDIDEIWGYFDEDARYVPRSGTDRLGRVSIWRLEIWAAVFAARKHQTYAEMLTKDMDYFLREGY